MNVRDISGIKATVKHTELVNICKAMGLDPRKTYADGIEGQGLRYGHVILMTDQDTDGSHIKGLIINFFHYYWPELLKVDGFLQQFITPLVKVRFSSKVAHSLGEGVSTVSLLTSSNDFNIKKTLKKKSSLSNKLDERIKALDVCSL